jgi:hypothetical protein
MRAILFEGFDWIALQLLQSHIYQQQISRKRMTKRSGLDAAIKAATSAFIFLDRDEDNLLSF